MRLFALEKSCKSKFFEDDGSMPKFARKSFKIYSFTSPFNKKFERQ